MNRNPRRIILYALLASMLVAWGGCGGSPGGGGEEDATVSDGGTEDGSTDTDGSTGIDAGVDSGTPTPSQPFQTVTSGGDRLSSANYNLTLFVAPVKPIGSASSPSHRVVLGPASYGSE